jgi:hypothetical protein
MAYEILKDEYYQPGLGPLGPGPLGIRYDPVTGDYELKQKSALGYDIGIGLAIFYKNGSWTSDAIRDPNLFVDGDPTKPTALSKQLSADIRKKVYAAYQTKGGAAGGNVVNATARPENQNSPAGVNNNFSGTNPGIATAIPGTGSLATLPGTGALAAPPGSINLNDITNLNFDSNNEDKIFKDSGLLLYPIDILKNQQDTLQITMYRYQPPAGDLFTNSNFDFSSVLIKGLQRNSALKKPIATTVLPIPSGIQDNNAIGWGDDSMNNLTAAVAGKVSSNPMQTGITQAAITTLATAVQAKFGVNLPSQSINQIATIGSAAGTGADLNALLQNQQTKAAITSLLLKNAGFEVPAETILARGYGIVPNSNLELLFQGPTLRQFGFTWRMSPRSASEARNVKRIIRMFKQGSAPRKLNSESGAGAASLFLGTPNVFKLSYKTAGNKEISGLNKFKICALVNMNVVYAPDGQWAAYDEGQPVSLTMTLNFQEIEPVYESDYQTKLSGDFTGDNRIDNYSSVKPDDVGY